MRCRNWLNELHLQQTLIFNRYTTDWCSPGDVENITKAQLYSWTLCWRTWYLILTEGPAKTFQANLSSLVAQAQEQRDPSKWGGGHMLYPQNCISGYLQSCRKPGFYIVYFFPASGSNNICTHLGKLPKTAGGFAAHEGLRSCQEESKMHDWGWSDNGLLLVAAQCHTSKAVGQWTELHQRLQGLPACTGSWGGSAISSAGTSRASCLLAWAAQPLARAHSLLGCCLLWLMTIINQTFYTPELYTEKTKKGGDRQRAFRCFADSTDNISSFMGHFSSPVWWVINL